MAVATVMRMINTFDPVPKFVRRAEKKELGRKLMQYGLCYHDVLVDSPAYKTAIARLPEEMQEARLRRIRRAVDLSVKKIVLPEDQWADPWREFDSVQSMLEVTQREMDEKNQLDGEAWFANGGDVTWYEYDVDESWFWRGIPDRKPEAPKLER